MSGASSEATFTTEQAAAELNIPASVIAKWKHRRLITPVGFIPGRGRDAPLYRLSEMQELVQRYRERQADDAARRARIRALARGEI